MINQQRKQNTVTHIYDQLRQSIISGELAEGSQLKQAEIGTQMGVSKIPVREALAMLEMDGFVTIHAGRGARVADLSAAEAHEIYLMRLALEPILLRDSLPHLDLLTLARADAILQMLDAMTEISTYEWHKLDREFHSLLYQGAPHERMKRTINNLQSNLGRYFVIFADSGMPFRQESNAEHREMLDACKRGDVDIACNLLTEMLKAGMSTLTEKLKNGGE